MLKWLSWEEVFLWWHTDTQDTAPNVKGEREYYLNSGLQGLFPVWDWESQHCDDTKASWKYDLKLDPRRRKDLSLGYPHASLSILTPHSEVKGTLQRQPWGWAEMGVA